MEFISAREHAQRAGIHLRKVQRSCCAGRIPGAVKIGNNWLIPSSADHQKDVVRKGLYSDVQELIAPYPEFLCGHADAFLASLQHDAYGWGLRGMVAYNRCEYKDALDSLAHILPGDAHYFPALLFKLYASIALGDFTSYRQIQGHLHGCLSQKGITPEVSLLLECIQANIHVCLGVVCNPPDWLQQGDLSVFPAPMRDLAWYTYIRYLQITKAYPVMLATAEARLSAPREPGCYTLSEILVLQYAALGYLKLNKPALARERMLKSMRLALPDRFIAPFADTLTIMQGLTERCLQEAFPELFNTIVAQWKAVFPCWLKARNELAEHCIPDILTKREHQVALCAAEGLTNNQIAQKLYLSVSTVKCELSGIYDKLGIAGRGDLKELF